MPRKRSRRKTTRPACQAGHTAKAANHTLHSFQVGALPIVNRILQRMQLEQFLIQHLPPDGPRTRLATRRGLLLLIRNLRLSREPIYGVVEWAAACAPDLLGLLPDTIDAINDDCYMY